MIFYLKSVNRLIFIIIMYLFIQPILFGQSRLITSSENTTGGITKSSSYTLTNLVGQNSPLGKLESGSFSLFSGFNSISDNIFRLVTLNSLQGSEILLAGSVYNITWSISYINFVNLEFSSDNGSSWIKIVTAYDGSKLSYDWTIPNLESKSCLLRITDSNNESIFDISENVFEIFIYNSTIEVANQISFGDFTKTESFRMVGLPGDLDLPISQIVSGEYGKDWKAAFDNGNSQNYLVEYDESDAFNFRPGKGFWLHSKNGMKVQTNAENVLIDQDYQSKISLHNGWNIISNPFNKNVQWTSIQSINGVTENIYFFEGSYSSKNAFEPYKAYYFYNVTNLNSLKIPFISTINNPSNLNKLSSHDYVDLVLTLLLKDKEEGKISIGFNRNAMDTYDEFDKFAPPSDFETVSIKLENENLETDYKYLNTEIRNSIENGQIFKIKIKLLENRNILLATEFKKEIFNNEIYLMENRLLKFYNLKSDPIVDLNLHSSENEFQLLIGNVDFIKEAKNRSIPQEISLFQNYPNPFNPNTWIRFSLPKESNVKLTVYNVLGEIVTELLNQNIDAGYHEVEFKKTNFSSGIYYYRLQSDKFVETKKMILLK